MIGVEDLQQQGRPERERNTAFRTVARIYIRYQFVLKMIFPEDLQVNRMILSLSDNIILRYIVIYQNLDFCYDQMVHPQKRCFLVLIFS